MNCNVNMYMYALTIRIGNNLKSVWQLEVTEFDCHLYICIWLLLMLQDICKKAKGNQIFIGFTLKCTLHICHLCLIYRFDSDFFL